jgi:hypothetical protein
MRGGAARQFASDRLLHRGIQAEANIVCFVPARGIGCLCIGVSAARARISATVFITTVSIPMRSSSDEPKITASNSKIFSNVGVGSPYSVPFNAQEKGGTLHRGVTWVARASMDCVAVCLQAMVCFHFSWQRSVKRLPPLHAGELFGGHKADTTKW